MNRWTFFSTHGIVPRGLEDAGEKKTTSQPAKAAAIPCRCREGGRVQGCCIAGQGSRAEHVLFVPRGHRHWMTRRCNGRTARAATVCAAWMGWADGIDGLAASCGCIGAPSLQSQQSAHDRDEREKGAPTEPKTGTHTHKSRRQRDGRVALTATIRKGFISCLICTERIARFHGTSQHGVQPLTNCRCWCWCWCWCCGCSCLLGW